jgi:hypothetical protein
MSAPASGPSNETQAVTLDLDPGRFRFSVWQNVSITIWTAQATMQAGHRILKLSRELSRKFPDGRSQVMIVAAGAPAPDDATTELLKEIYDPNVSRILCIAAVLEGQGFWASGIRSRMTKMRIAAGNAMAMNTLDAVEQVADWLPEEHAKRTGVTLDPDVLTSVLVATRALGTRDASGT